MDKMLPLFVCGIAYFMFTRCNHSSVSRLLRGCFMAACRTRFSLECAFCLALASTPAWGKRTVIAW